MKKKTPLVSIIVNCYNGEKHLEKCLNSVINQTYTNWEIIFWDNKSFDKSKKIFFRFANDKRFKYFFAEKFTTLYKARNLALQKSQGEILTFLDVDDFWLPTKLEQQVNVFLQYKDINLVYSNYFNLKNFFLFKIFLKNKNKLHSGMICNDLLRNYCVSWLTVAIRNNNKIKKKLFNEKLDLVSDYDFVIRFSLRNKIFSINDYLAVYRQHADQLTRKKFHEQANHYCNWYNMIKKNKKINKMSNFKFLKNRYNFYHSIKFISSKKYLSEKLIYIFKIKDVNLKLKLFLFFLFPNIFVKYIMSI